jgi:alkanesulfonate monooxygenase SsuD/methylene tetrahydromethanopterin reductase-like flavin-dependent oxidoreductase (luciferase family)
MTKIRFGVIEPSGVSDPRYLKEIALQFEDLGYYSLWVADRLKVPLVNNGNNACLLDLRLGH